MKFAQLSVVASLVATSATISLGDFFHPLSLAQKETSNSSNSTEAAEPITENLNATAPAISIDDMEDSSDEIDSTSSSQ